MTFQKSRGENLSEGSYCQPCETKWVLLGVLLDKGNIEESKSGEGV
jgi:hypothetical protein